MIYNVNGSALNAGYDDQGAAINTAYNKSGDVVFSLMDGVIINQDDSTGTASGYVLTSELTGNSYAQRLMMNFWEQTINMQSCVYDPTANVYYCFSGGWYVAKYNSNYQYVETITLPQSMGHNNDGYYNNGSIILTHNTTTLFVWNPTANTVSTLPITGIANPVNGSVRYADAICMKENGMAYIACRDVYNSSDIDHQEGDNLTIYSYNLSTGVATLEAEYDWDCVYIQGMTMLDGIIYIACNTQTTGSASNYLGITVKVIRTDTWELIDELIYSGNVEPEGMDVVPADGGYQIEMGVAHSGAISMATRFTAPYTLE